MEFYVCVYFSSADDTDDADFIFFSLLVTRIRDKPLKKIIVISFI